MSFQISLKGKSLQLEQSSTLCTFLDPAALISQLWLLVVIMWLYYFTAYDIVHWCRRTICIIAIFLHAWVEKMCHIENDSSMELFMDSQRIKFQLEGLQSKSSCKGSAQYMELLWYVKVCFGYCEPLSMQTWKAFGMFFNLSEQQQRRKKLGVIACKKLGHPGHDLGETISTGIDIVKWTKRYWLVKLCRQNGGGKICEVRDSANQIKVDQRPRHIDFIDAYIPGSVRFNDLKG